MKDLIKLPLLIILWICLPFFRIISSISSFFVRFVYKENQVYLYKGCCCFRLYRVTHVPLFGSPSFNIIQLYTFRTDEKVYEDIRYEWNQRFYSYYIINRCLQVIPYNEFIPIEQVIRETEKQIGSIVKDAVSHGNHPSAFKIGMVLCEDGGYIYHLIKPEQNSAEWLVSHISLNELLSLHEDEFYKDFEDDDKPDYIEIPESVWYQIIEIVKERHAVLQKMLLSIKDRYKAEKKQENFDITIANPWGIY